jgi:hypothetical protein
MTAQTALFTATEAPRAAFWKVWLWLGKGAAALVARFALAFLMIVVGGVIAPLLAAEAIARCSGLSG